MKRNVLTLIIFISAALLIFSCSDDSSPKDTNLKVIVISGVDSVTAVKGADVTVFNSEGTEKGNKLTDVEGECVFELNGGNHYLNINAEGFDSIPSFGAAPDTFLVRSERTTEREVYLRPNTVLKVIVKDNAGGLIENSNVVVYRAETNQSLQRDFTDADGECYFIVNEGNYYLDVSAQGFDPSPAPTVTPVPFFVTREDTTAQERVLNTNPLTDTGSITGYIEPAVNNFLVVADDGTEALSTVSGPDGFFVLFNLPYATYGFRGFKSGYDIDSFVPDNAVLSASDPTEEIAVNVSEFSGYQLTGKVDFRATEDSTGVDIVLRDPETLSVIPGLRTRTYLNVKQENGDYTLSGIPNGDFIAWASLENDGYVLDPDWLFQNPDGLNLSYPADSIKILNFPCTGSIKIVSPTNPMDSIYAIEADSATPEFKWVVTSSCSSRKEWFLEVRDINGNIMWGGFNADGTVNHDFIGPGTADTLSVSYNFDGRGNALVPGEIYQWRIWADGGTNQDSFVQNLISASEDLRGIFKVSDVK